MYRAKSPNIASYINNISTKRLSNYKKIHPTKTDNEIYGMYCWNSELSTRINMVIGIYEICLRNKIHSVMSDYIYNKMAKNNKIDGDGTSCNWYDQIKISETLRNEIDRVGSDSKDKIISSLSHGTWRHIFNIEKDNNEKPIPWSTLIPKIFSSAPPGYFNRKNNLDSTKLNLTRINKLRNKVAHFEPVWRNKELKDFSGKRIIKKAPTTIADHLARLKSEYTVIISTLKLISSDYHDFYISTRNHAEIMSMMHISSLNSFMSISESKKIDVNSEKLPEEIISYLSNDLSRNWSFEITNGDRTLGYLRKS